MGGMSAQVIAKSNPKEINEKALAGVKNDKERELKQGNDGAWVAHPSLVAPVKSIFEKNFKLFFDSGQTVSGVCVERRRSTSAGSSRHRIP